MLMSLRDVGWVWEGQGIDPGVPPSVFGVGGGCEFFGLKRATFLFHPNTETALAKLSGLEEVVCDIIKWKFVYTGDGGWKCGLEEQPGTMLTEARKVNRLADKFPNVTGAFLDDFAGIIKRHPDGSTELARVRTALTDGRPDLKLWTVVYSHELDADFWRPYLPLVDVVNLWVWESTKDLLKLDEYVDRAGAVFAGKPLVIGCYVRDYPTAAAVPMELVKFQFERIVRYLQEGKIAGYSILGAVLIDVHPKQACWIRDFIAAHS